MRCEYLNEKVEISGTNDGEDWEETVTFLFAYQNSIFPENIGIIYRKPGKYDDKNCYYTVVTNFDACFAENKFDNFKLDDE